MANRRKSKSSGNSELLFLIFAILVIIGFYFIFSNINTSSPKSYDVGEFIDMLECEVDNAANGYQPGDAEYTCEHGEITAIRFEALSNDNPNLYVITGTIVQNSESSSFTLNAYVNYDTYNYIYELATRTDVNIPATITPLQSFAWITYLISFIFILFFIYVIVSFRRSSGSGKGNEITRNRAKITPSNKLFKDVAGCDEEKQELEEVIDFLKNPKKYHDIGARIPKGILLVGPPGTGKTLLAKAVAGEAHVPFFSISGSDFIELYVGTGAGRVRSLFNDARKHAPCLIFIDEIDAIGKQRGTGIGGGNDEREQTLNQILVEMDGFQESTGIILMAATNRPDVLDPALLRPGRFDRRVTVAAPDVIGREEIIKIHVANKKLKDGIKLSDIAKRTPGFVGADLENLVNEAALLAARDNRKIISLQDLDEAIDRVIMGPAKKSKVMSKRERETIAHHEAGHAVIGLKLDNAQIVHKVTIIPRGQAGGYAMMLPENEESFIKTKQSLLDSITGLLGGRVAEEIIFNEISTGAHNDIQRATQTARSMVTEYGMSSLGAVQYEERSGSVFLGRDYGNTKNFSDTLALEIDKEVRSIIEECYEIARKVLNENLDLVKKIAEALLEIETLTCDDINDIVKTGKVTWYEEMKVEKAKKAKEDAEKAKKAEAEKSAEVEKTTEETKAVESDTTKE